MSTKKFDLIFTEYANEQLNNLENEKHNKKNLKAVQKALGYLQIDPRHPSLNTHKYDEMVGYDGEEVFEAYAQNQTPGAYRIFWHYGPGKKKITIIEISPHP